MSAEPLVGPPEPTPDNGMVPDWWAWWTESWNACLQDVLETSGLDYSASLYSDTLAEMRAAGWKSYTRKHHETGQPVVVWTSPDGRAMPQPDALREFARRQLKA